MLKDSKPTDTVTLVGRKVRFAGKFGVIVRHEIGRDMRSTFHIKIGTATFSVPSSKLELA